MNTTCEHTTSVPGPNPGCAEFAGPEEIPCSEPASVLVRMDARFVYPGDDPIVKLHVCPSHAKELMSDPDFIDVAVAT